MPTLETIVVSQSPPADSTSNNVEIVTVIDPHNCQIKTTGSIPTSKQKSSNINKSVLSDGIVQALIQMLVQS